MKRRTIASLILAASTLAFTGLAAADDSTQGSEQYRPLNAYQKFVTCNYNCTNDYGPWRSKDQKKACLKVCKDTQFQDDPEAHTDNGDWNPHRQNTWTS